MPRQNMLFGNTGGYGNSTRLAASSRPARYVGGAAGSATGVAGRLAQARQNASRGVATGVAGAVAGIGNKSGGVAGAAAGARVGTPTYKPTSPVATGASVNNWASNLAATANQAPKTFNASTAGNTSSYKQLEQQLNSGPDAPKLPGQINLDNYATEMATINDIAEKYGFDYSREYAEQQAEAIAQAQRDEIATSRERGQYELDSATENLEHDFFQDYLAQRQSLADTGLNAGIAAERDLRLGMNMQHAMSDIFANNQLYNQELDRRESTITAEELAYADRLYNERLQQGFGNAMDVSRFEQSENQWQANMAMQQRAQQVEEAWREFEFNNMSESEKQRMLQSERQFGVEQAWREYQFNNMSAAERARLAADAERFGMEMAWERHRFESGMAFESTGSFSSEGGGGGGNFSSFRVTSNFGPRKSPTAGASSNHKGMDFATPMNTPIGSTVGGKVIRSGTTGGWGNYVAVQDSSGHVHIYAHLNNMNVKAGQTISAGTIIGRSGNSGVSTGPHLHYEVRKGGIGGSAVNPNRWL